MTSREQDRGGERGAARVAMNDEDVTPEGLQQLIRDALGDPTLALALAVPETDAYVDVHGAAFELPRRGAGRAVLPVVRHGRAVAAVVHDPELEADAAVVEGLAVSCLMLLADAQLVAELRASRRRIVTEIEGERLRLERDVHDGAQQRLMAIQIKLALLRERIDEPGLGAELDEIAEDTDAAVVDLREVAQRIYPTVLRERGLGDALRSLARSFPLTVEVTDNGIGRCAPVVETAIYFCAAEAMDNAVKHAGSGARVRMSLDRRGEDVFLAVVDDGAGFDAAVASSSGGGLVGMHDRIAAVGGDLEITSTPGKGTAVRGRVPASRSVSADG